MKRIASLYKNQRMQLVRSSLAMLSFLILFVAPAMATHIVGGSISYRCLGNDQYEITVRVYRDCFNAAPGADFDDPASIGIFDRAGLLVADVRVPFVKEDTVTNLPAECLVIPGNICVNTTTYITRVELPFREGGYQLVYQRCCRNETVQNIVDPLETGATYDIWLTEEAMQSCNSSPVFREWPPIFICVNEELNFDHSAIDADGDSLVYKLIAPLQGGTFAQPMPQPPNPPPYDEVVLIEPTYSVDNFLGFGEPLQVNQDNGLMTVTPSILGQFVVGVSVEEYDRETGELLSTSRRDFQYNVIQCEPFEAAFNAPEAVCDQFTVQFDNQTAGATEFLWNFTGTDTAFTSTERSPEVTFPDVGLYNVELIVEPNSVCEVRFDQDILVQTNSLTADFRVDVLACTDSSYLFLTDRSVDSVSAPVAWEWIISPEGMDPFTVNGQFPVVQVPMDSKGTIQLNVTSENNCTSSLTMSYEAPGIDLRTYLQDTIFACIGDQITLNPLTPPDVQLDYNWSGPGISDPGLINPMIEVQAGATVYQLTISGPENSCFIETDIVVMGGERPELDFAVGTNCDGLSYRFEDLSTNATSIEWIIGDLSAPLLITQETSFDFTFPSEGSYPVYLIGVAGCTDTLLRNIEIQNNDLDIGIDVRYTDCEADQVEVQLMAQTATSDSIISYDWRLSDGKTATDPNPVFSFGESQTLTARLIVETLRGCVDSIEQELEINLITDVLARLPDTVALCEGVPTALFPENDDRYTYEWSPAEGLDDPTSSNPVFLQPGVYSVTISIPGSATCRVETQVVSFLPEDINLEISVAELPDTFDPGDDAGNGGSSLDDINLDDLMDLPIIDGKVTSCEDALLISADTEPGTSVSWYLNGEEVSADSLYYLAQAMGENTYTAIATDRYGCTDTSSVVIDLQGVDIALPDQVAVCDGEPILVTAENTDPNDELTYTWSPADWVLAGQGTANANFDAPIGINYVYVEATNQLGCTTIDSVEVVVVDPNHDLKFEVTALCDSVTVRFTNQSENAFGYLWNFGDPENPDATSTEESPIYTYSEPGTYTALLTLQYDVSCRDTFELTFNTNLLPPDLGLELNLPDTLFTGGNPITVGTMVDAETYTWTDSSGQVIGTESSITVDPDCEAVYYLEVSDEFGCVYRDTVLVINEIIDVVLTPPSPVTICDGDQVQLMVENQKDCHILSYVWGPDSLILSGGNSANPIYTFDKEGTYQGTGIITNQYGVSDTLLVDFVVGEIESGLMDTLVLCEEDSIRLGMNSNPDYTYTWSPGDDLDDPNSNNPLFSGSETTTYFVTVTDGVCEVMDTVTVIVPDVRLESDLPDTLYTEGNPITIETMVDAEMYTWTDTSGQVIGTGPSITVDPNCEAYYYLQMTDEFGCEYQDTVLVINRGIEVVIDPVSPVTICDADQVQIMVENLKAECDTLTFLWGPDSLIFSGGNTPNPIFTFDKAGNYQGTGIIRNQYGTVDTLLIDFNVGTLETGLMDTIVVCDPGPVNLGPDTNPDYTYTWSPGDNLDDPNSNNPLFSGSETATYFVTVTDGVCEVMDTVTVIVPDVRLEPDLPDTLYTGGNPITIETMVDAETYTWTDSSGQVIGTGPSITVDPECEAVYYLEMTDEFGCIYTDSVVVINESIDVVLTPSSPVTICDGDQVQLMVENQKDCDTLSYVWGPDSLIFSGGNTANPIYTFDKEGTYQGAGIITNQYGVSDTLLVDFVVGEIESGLMDTLVLCEEDSIRLGMNSNPDYTYTWSPGDDLDDPNSNNPLFSGSETATYFVTVTDGVCEVMDTVTVIVPDVRLEPDLPDTLYTDGDPITIETMVDAEMYTWTDTSGQVIGTGPSITVDPDCEAIYYLQMTDEFGCEYNDTVVVINPIIEVAVLPESPITLCVGDEVQLMVENLKDCDTLSYSWSPDSILVSGGNTDSPTFRFDEAGNYQAIGIVTNQYGTMDTIVVDFNVGNLDGLGLMSPLTGCVGDAFDLFPGADSTLAYSWSPADLLNDPTAPNPRTIPLDRDTTFFVTVTLPGTSCVIEDTVVVDVNDDIILDISADPGLRVCPQTTVTLEAELDEGATIAWLDADGNLLGTTDTLAVDVMGDPIEITAVARDTNGCEQRQTITLTPEELEVGLDGPVEACAEIPTPINPGGSSDYNYEWSPAAGLDDPFSPNPIFDATMDQTFAVTVTDPETGCVVMDSVEVNIIEHPSITLTTNDTMICEPDLITLSAETDLPATLEWFADAAMTMSLGTGASIEVLPKEGVNQYFVKTDDLLCVDDRDVDTVLIEVVDFSTVAPDTLIEICKDEMTFLNPNGDDRFSYEWSPAEGLDDPLSPNPAFDGAMDQDFNVTITSPDGMCMVEREVRVRLDNPVNLEAGTDTILCREGSFTLEAMHEGGQNVMWASDRDFTENVSNGDIYEIDLEDGGRYYYVKADNGLGCTEIDSILVGSGLIDAILPEEVIVCDASEGAVLMVTNNKPEQELTYMWMPEDKLESDPLSGPMATLLPGADGLVSVLLENQYGCTAELNTRVVIDDVGSASIEASDTTVQVGNPVELSVVDCEDCQYQWSPPETIDNPNARTVTATPLETTEYFVTVTKGDCETVLSITIMTQGVLCSTDNIFIPKAFTPNGDNQNDVLFVRSNVIDELHFIIYNRWGQEVFDTRNPEEGWDGTFRGNELPPDVYGYYLRARCIDDSEITLQGNVTLLR